MGWTIAKATPWPNARWRPPNLVMWARDHYFPQTYAHAGWERLLPFFRLPGLVTVDHEYVRVEFRLFNGQQLNEDLMTLCGRVNQTAPRLPDGRHCSCRK